jgi:hypothetical protein
LQWSCDMRGNEEYDVVLCDPFDIG